MKRFLLALCLWLPALAQFNNTVTTDNAGVLQNPDFFRVNQGTLGLNAILRTNGTAVGTTGFEQLTADQITGGKFILTTPFTGTEADNELTTFGWTREAIAPAIGEDVADLLALPVYAISRWAYLTTDEKFWVFCPDITTADNGTTIRRPTSVASDASPGRWVQITLAGGGGGGGGVSSVAMTVPSFLSVTGSPITSSGTLVVTLSGTALPVANGGSGATTLTGYVKGNGTSAFTAAATVPWADIASKPTTLSGYGITDAQPLDSDLTAIAALTTTAFGRGLLDDADAAAGRTSLGLGSLATQSGTFSGTSSGNNTGDQTITLTGPVTGTGTGSFATTITDAAVTYAKIQDVSAASRLLGRGSAAGAGDVQEITLGSGLSMSGTTLSASGSGVATIIGENGIGVSGTSTVTLSLGAITPTGVTSSGNITGNNLSGVNTGDETASGILSKLLTVDGAGSGIDADLLDGISSAGFQAADSALTAIAGGSDFVQFTGPTTSTKVFTLPNASAVVLTDNAAVTVAQGGTGLGTLTANNVILGNGTSSPTFVAPGASGNVLTSNGTTWTSAAPSGGGGWSTGILFTSGSTTAVIDNSAAETSVFSGTIPGGTLGTSGAVRVILTGQILQDSGSGQGFTLRVKLGSTTMYADASNSTIFGSNANRRTWRMEFTIFADGSASAQRFEGLVGPFTAAAGTTSGIGDLAASVGLAAVAIGGTATEDSTADRTFEVTIQLTAANANYEWFTLRGLAFKL